MNRLISVMLIVLVFSLNALGESYSSSPIMIDLDGKEHLLNFSDGNENELTAYAVVSGNVSSYALIDLFTPRNTRVNASISILNGSPLKLLQKPSKFSPLQVMTEDAAQQFSSTPCITLSPGETNTKPPPIERTESDSPLCELFPPEYKIAIGDALTAVYGGPWSDAQICGFIVNNYHGGAEECEPSDMICQIVNSISSPAFMNQSLMITDTAVNKRYVIRLSRDACAPPRTKYLLRLNIQVPKHSKPTVGSIAIQQRFFKGSKAASIQPISDGLFAPQPILLMNYLGNFCGQKVEIAKWFGGKIQSRQVTEVKDLIPYKNFILTRTPIGKFLKGGHATFELFNGKTNYGVCFALERRRQKVNGY